MPLQYGLGGHSNEPVHFEWVQTTARRGIKEVRGVGTTSLLDEHGDHPLLHKRVIDYLGSGLNGSGLKTAQSSLSPHVIAVVQFQGRVVAKDVLFFIISFSSLPQVFIMTNVKPTEKMKE